MYLLQIQIQNKINNLHIYINIVSKYNLVKTMEKHYNAIPFFGIKNIKNFLTIFLMKIILQLN